MPKVPHIKNEILVSVRKPHIKYKLHKIPAVATKGKNFTLKGRSIFGSRTLSNQTAPHIMANANKVPELHISETLSIGVKAETTDTIPPTKIVDFQGVLNLG